MIEIDPAARLLFWQRASFLGDAVLLLVGIALLARGDLTGWWIIAFDGVRIVLGLVALFVVTPRVLARRRSPA